MRSVRARQEGIWPRRREFHVLTYAEEGFAPLNIHAESAGFAKEQLLAFVEQVNRRFGTGSLHPRAPISAVPRALIRNLRDTDLLRHHIAEFLRANVLTIRATKLMFDFRTPGAPRFAIEAIEAALLDPSTPVLDEVVFLD